MASTVMISKMLFDRARIVSNENSMRGRTMSKYSFIFWPTNFGRIWIYFICKRQVLKSYNSKFTIMRDLPMLAMTMSGP